MNTKNQKFKENDIVKRNGETGRVYGYYSEGMITVRLPGGLCTVAECDAELIRHAEE